MEKFEELIQSEKPVLVDFFATWCGPCKAMHPVLEELKNEIGDAARIAKIDVDQHEELAARYRIQAVPTFIVFKKGEAVWRHSGVISGKDLKAVIEQNSKQEEMKKIIAMVALVFSCMLAYAQTNGEVIVMNKAMFIKDVFDYEKSQDWKYKGNKPAIIDLYADWCGPCRMVAPIMKELAKEYADKIVVYKVNVDKEKELAALFNATSIPLFVFIPMNGEPQLFRGAADKATYKKAIDDFLLKTE